MNIDNDDYHDDSGNKKAAAKTKQTTKIEHNIETLR
jgi:hypothetical protein